MIYLDSSAVVKLVHEESESGGLELWLSGDERPLVTSALTEIEVERALRRSDPDALPLLPEIIDGLYWFDIDVAVRQAAARFAEPTLRTVVGQRQRGWASSSTSRSMSNPSCHPVPSTSRS